MDHTHSPVSSHPPCGDQQALSNDSALAVWLDDVSQPDDKAMMSRLWLSYPQASALLTELHHTEVPISVGGVLYKDGVSLYLRLRTLSRALSQRLLTYDPAVIQVTAEEIESAAVWACGRSLARLVAVNARTMSA